MIIKTPRPLWRTLLDLSITSLAWAMFAYWFLDGVYDVVRESAKGLGAAFFDEFFPSVRTIMVYSIVGGLNASLLFGWALSNRMRFRGKDRRRALDPINTELMARRFGLQEQQLARLRAMRIVDITHTLDGGIERIDPTNTG